MKRTGKLIAGLAGIIGIGGCESLQEAGPVIAGYVIGAHAASNPNLTPEGRAALAHAAEFMEDQRRNEAINSRTIVNINTGSQLTSYPSQSTGIEKVWVDYNVNVDGKNGMRIHTRFIVSNRLGSNLKVSSYFYDNNGKSLKSKGDPYRCGYDETCSATGILTPNFDPAHYEDVITEIPYETLERSIGRNDYKLKVILWDLSSNEPKNLSQSPPLDFWVAGE